MKMFYTLFIALLFSTYSFSQDINGLWEDSAGTSLTNCHVIFAAKNDSVFMTHYIEFNGVPFVEYGNGIITNDSLIYEVTVTKGIPGWSTAGTHHLKIFDNGNTLRGTYHDNKGKSGMIVFKRKKLKKTKID
ncbi:MAG: hypothetical protein ACJA0Q_000148 [Saprospiraceae bacterium]|jgi:hypothetical protein